MCTLIWVAPRLSADIKELDEVCVTLCVYMYHCACQCVCMRTCVCAHDVSVYTLSLGDSLMETVVNMVV